jgi:hypothetical protein
MKKDLSNAKALENTAAVILEIPSVHNFDKKKHCGMQANPTDILEPVAYV